MGHPSEFIGRTETGGACMMDVTGSGQMDLVLMESGRAGDSRAASRVAMGSLKMWMRRLRG